MKKLNKIFNLKIKSALITVFVVFILLFNFSSQVNAQTSFRFVAWGDTKSDTNVLKNLSAQIKTLNPKLTIYAGDLESDGFTTAGMDAWKAAVNAGVNNGIFNITFPDRGNHDDHLSGAATNWQNYFNIGANVSFIGGSNYSALSDDLTYSFDYGNSRFIAIDTPGSVSQMNSAQIAWMDSRLTDAENRGLTHAFLFWHGPIYSQANHCCPTPPSALITVLNKHPIVSATFHGHEHILTYAHLNSSRVPGLTREFEQFVSGDAGAGPTTPTSGRYDYSVNLGSTNSGGFVAIDVSGTSFTATFYKGGSSTPQWSRPFTKGGGPPPPTATPGGPPTRTPTPVSGCARKGQGDVDCNGIIDLIDFEGWRREFTGFASTRLADFSADNAVNLIDFEIWRRSFAP